MNLTPETEVHLNKFKPRAYQKCLFDAILNMGYKKVLAVWPRRCLSGDTHITMSDGSWKFLKDIEVGDEIISWDGTRFVPDIVKNKWSTGIKETVKLQSYGYLPVVTSKDHQFASLTQSREDVSWVSAGMLRPKRQVLNYAGLEFGTHHDPDLAEFIGYMITDGYCSGYQQPKFTNTNKGILMRVAYLSKKLFNYDPIWREKGNGYDLGFTNGTRGGGATKNKVKELFRQYNLDVSKEKRRILPIVWNFDEESLGRFFAAVISSDGSIYGHQKGFTGDRDRGIPPANEISIHCGLSYLMAWDFYWLLRKIGIVPQVPKFEKESNWKVRVSKGYGLRWLLSKGPIYGKEDKQGFILARLPFNPHKPNNWNGCYRCRQCIEDAQDEELYDIETMHHHNFVANGYVVHNSGKDMCAWNICIQELIRKTQTIYYIFPTYASGRKILWDAITNDGFRILDYMPKEVIESRNEQLMRIRLKNGSVFQVIGSDNYDNALVGTNPQGVVFSEFAISNPLAYGFVRPILSANNGWALIVSTPRGKNFLWEMYNVGLANPQSWFVSKLTVDDTGHIPLDVIERERAEGEMSEDLQMQEYWTSFEMGIEGAYYTKYMDKARLDGRIGDVPWEVNHKVHTAWDLGVRDATTIIFVQIIGQTIRIIDCYENSKVGLEHYANILKSKPYTYGKHIAPHDIRVQELGSGITRLAKARELGINFTIAEKTYILDGIEAVRSSLGKMWFDQEACAPLIKSIDNYRQEYDQKKKVYKSSPLHNWASHFCDGMRYLSTSLSKLRTGLTPEELDARYKKAMYGEGIHHGIFADRNKTHYW